MPRSEVRQTTRRRLERAELALESLRKCLVDTDESASGGQRQKWSIPDRKIAMKYLIAVKDGMDPKQWA
jgi:ABC-type phosphate transport system ATPase subunit